MIGKKQTRESKLYYVFDLESRVPPDHPLRQVAGAIDFDFVRQAVANHYGRRGNPSIDPIVLLKLIFICFFENVHSERELLRQLPLRLDWLWFCGFDIDQPVPHHSVLSKARRRWGRELFVEFFQRVLDQCVQAGLVDGQQVYVDASVNRADASMDSLATNLQLRGQALFDILEADAPSQDHTDAEPAGPAKPGQGSGDSSGNDSNLPQSPRPKRISHTDPEARLTRSNGKHVLGYKDHRAVDDRFGVITATVTTDAAVDEAKMIVAVLDQHEQQTGEHVRVAVADKGYGQTSVYQQLHVRGTKACIPHQKVGENRSKFRRKLFVYDPARDDYTCPAGQRLTRRGERYSLPRGTCASCALRSQCTDNKVIGRRLRRHRLQDEIDRADRNFSRPHRRRLMRRRKTVVEGSFADAANRHGYKRHRWRGLKNATIQNLLIAAAQNLRKLIRYGRRRPVAIAATVHSWPAFAWVRRIERLISQTWRSYGLWSTPHAAL